MNTSLIFQTAMKYRNPQYRAAVSAIANSFRSKSDHPKSTADLCSSTILIQDGANVQELPVLVKRVKNISLTLQNVPQLKSERVSSEHTRGENDVHQLIQREFRRCSNLDEVFSLLSRCSTVTPNIALGAVERIYDLADPSRRRLNDAAPENAPVTQEEILNKLIHIILRNEDVYGLLRALKSICSKNEEHLHVVCDEILERVTENKLSVHQLCDVVTFFGVNKHVEKFADSVDKLWVGFVEREKELDEESIVKCLGVLKYLKDSQKVVLGVLEKRITLLWWQMKPNTIIEVLNCAVQNKFTTSKVFFVLGRWVNTNIHTLSEDALLQIVANFTELGYVDMQIERAIERYIKAKGLKISSHPLMVAVVNYFTSHRIRNPHVLNGCAEYFIVNGKSMNPMFVKPFVHPLGYLNYQPINGAKFWKELEEILEMKILKINLEDAIDIMQSCIYLQKYPLNFINYIFNPNTLERINASPNANVLKSKLKQLDVSFTLESEAYNGPLLPKDLSVKSFWYDGRIKRIVNNIRETFETVAGGADCMSTSILVPSTFPSDLYVVDVMLHPKGLRSSLLNSNFRKDRDINVAVLINLPEHFTSNGETMLGEQEMRIRHLRIMGLKVVNLKYETLARLKIHRKELEKYIVSQMKQAQSAI